MLHTKVRYQREASLGRPPPPMFATVPRTGPSLLRPWAPPPWNLPPVRSGRSRVGSPGQLRAPAGRPGLQLNPLPHPPAPRRLPRRPRPQASASRRGSPTRAGRSVCGFPLGPVSRLPVPVPGLGEPQPPGTEVRVEALSCALRYIMRTGDTSLTNKTI